MGLKVYQLNLDNDKLPFDDESFDVVFAFEVFEHFANPQNAIEEIKRVLKENGNLLVSTPNPLTHHWPRLFYPQLFEREAFLEFLMINGFDTNFFNDWLLQNAYKELNISVIDKSWSFFYFSSKIPQNDYLKYFEQGVYFWDKENSQGLKTCPIEAIELFRKSYKINTNYRTKLMLILSLVYRACYNDTDEFGKLLAEFVEEMKSEESINNEYVYALISIEAETIKLGNSILEKSVFEKYYQYYLSVEPENSEKALRLKRQLENLQRLLNN